MDCNRRSYTPNSACDSSHDDHFVHNSFRQEPQGQEYSNAESRLDNYSIRENKPDERCDYTSQRNLRRLSKNSSKSYSDNDASVSELTDIPEDYLSQSHVLKHLAKEANKVPSKGVKSREYLPYYENVDFNETFEEGFSNWPATNIMTFKIPARSKSQPNIRALKETEFANHSNWISDRSKENDEKRNLLVDHLIRENNRLKVELESCYQKVAISQKLEHEVGKIHRAHEDLIETCERKECLERTARSRLQNEIRRLQDTNCTLRDQLESLNKKLYITRCASPQNLSDQSKKDTLIAQLISQNKELLATKDRQDIELSAQRVTLEEQRTHIDILDTALTNAQANVVRLEDDCQKNKVHGERVAQLQRALSSLQMASERRERTERKLRSQLEHELQSERARNNKLFSTFNTDTENGDDLADLKRKLREKDEKMMRLEGEISKWEQRYLEESELRQAAISAAIITKDAKISVLEKSNKENEIVVSEARADKLRYMDELHVAQRKISELESKMKDLECKLAERDAMIRVLQKKNSYENESCSPYSSLGHRRPNHCALIGSQEKDIGGKANSEGGGDGESAFSSRAFADSYGCSSMYKRDDYDTVDEDRRKYRQISLNDHLKELDSQLLTKDSLIQALCREKEKHPSHYWQV